MLPERLSQLLTAYIDGEATASQRQAVERLLEQSAEARALLQQLQENIRLLQNLPQQRLTNDFSGQVMRQISARRLSQRRRLVEPALPSLPIWTGLAVAAGVFLVVAWGSYLYFVATWHKDSAESQFVTKTPAPGPIGGQSHRIANNDAASEQAVDANREQRTAASPEVARSDSDDPLPLVDSSDSARKPKPDDELAIPKPKREKLEVFTAPLPLRMALTDLEREETRARLQQQLQRASEHRLELFCQGNGKAVERLQTLLLNRNIRLLMDPEVKARLTNRRLFADYALFVEGMSPGDVVTLLQDLRSADCEAEAKRKGDSQFGKVLILPLTRTDRQELTTLLGLDPLQPTPPRPKAPLGVDIHKPISQATADRVLETLEGKGPPRPGPGKSVVVKAPERLAVLLPYTPLAPKPATLSREVKQFLDSRPERKTGSVQLFVVLRKANG
jgi:hypothetical protein